MREVGWYVRLLLLVLFICCLYGYLIWQFLN